MKNLTIIALSCLLLAGCVTDQGTAWPSRKKAFSAGGPPRSTYTKNKRPLSYSKTKLQVGQRDVPSLRAPAKYVPATKSSFSSTVTKQHGNPSSAQLNSVDQVTVYLLKPNDRLSIFLRGIPQEVQIDDIIDENGYINMPYITSIKAAGLTRSELEDTIQQSYVDGKIYKNITVNVVIPTLSYFIRGEVKSPGQKPMTPGVTMLQAVAAAGGYTEYANPKKVKIVRGSQSYFVNAKDFELHPERDKLIEAGDVIVVNRSVW